MYFSPKFFLNVRIAFTWGGWFWQRQPIAIAAVTHSCTHRHKRCQPQSHQPRHSTDPAVSLQLGHIRQNVVRFTLPATMKGDTPLCLPKKNPWTFASSRSCLNGLLRFSVYCTERLEVVTGRSLSVLRKLFSSCSNCYYFKAIKV